MASASIGATRRQEMPPSGGFKPLDFTRVPAKSVIGSKGLIFGHFALTGLAMYLYTVNYKKVRWMKIEQRSSSLAITPLLTAERDRAYLKELVRLREEEEKLMAGVEGWQVGTLYGEPVYQTTQPDKLTKPHLYEYYAHASPSAFTEYFDFVKWS